MFSEKLLEAKGFENHYLVQQLGENVRASLSGRVPAISKKRQGVIDIALRKFKEITMATQSLNGFDDLAFATMEWENSGVVTRGDVKKTFHFTIESILPNIMEGEQVSPDNHRLVEIMEHEFFFNPADYDVTQHLCDQANYERWEQHPVFCLFEEIHSVLLREPELKYDGLTLDYEDNGAIATFHYTRTVGDQIEYLLVRCDLDAIEDELNIIVG